MASDHSRIVALIQEHEAALTALRTTLALLDGGRAESSAKRSGNTISQALAVEAARQAQNGNGHGNGQGKGHHKSAIMARRQHTGTLLAQFDRTEPRRVAGNTKLGVLIQHGYLAPKGDGWVRTDKAYSVDPRARQQDDAPAKKAAKKPGYWNPVATAARRKKTAAVLATYDTKKPKPLQPKAGLGAAVAAGYLRAQGDGYVRTAKVFTP